MSKIIKIDTEVSKKIEALQYEVESRRQVIGYMISANTINTDAFKKYEKEYKDFFIQYEKAKSEMEAKYIVPVAGGSTVNWNLNFLTCEVTIDE